MHSHPPLHLNISEIKIDLELMVSYNQCYPGSSHDVVIASTCTNLVKTSFCHHLNEYVHCCVVISCQTIQLKAEEIGKWVSDWKENPIDNNGAFKKNAASPTLLLAEDSIVGKD